MLMRFEQRARPPLDRLGTGNRHNAIAVCSTNRLTDETRFAQSRNVALHFMHYNFCRVHQTLRVTPAKAASLFKTGRFGKSKTWPHWSRHKSYKQSKTAK